VVVSVDDVSKAVEGLPKLSGCGCSGDTVDFWKLALKYEDMIDSLYSGATTHLVKDSTGNISVIKWSR